MLLALLHVARLFAEIVVAVVVQLYAGVRLLLVAGADECNDLDAP